MATKTPPASTKETIEAFTANLGGVKSQRELGKMLAAEQAGDKRRPYLAAIERRMSARAKEVKAAQRSQRPRPISRDPATGKKAGKPAPQNAVPIAPGSFGSAGARPLAEAYMDVAGEMKLSVAFGDARSLIRNLEPVEGVAVLPRNGNLVTSAVVEIDTAGLPGRLEITHAYLLDGGKPIGMCELAAPLPLDPGQRAAFPAGHLMFRS